MESNKKFPLVFYVNGKKVIETEPNPETTLLTYLRENLGLCGTKLGCGEGGCGACTVMLSKIINRQNRQLKHFAINACLTPVCAVHGLSVTTVEGIGSTKTKLHPVQERIAAAHGTQCGYCTPGFVMSMYALLRTKPLPTMKEMEIAFQGNLCRCTGYRPIIEGYRSFTQEFQCGMGDKCCKLDNNNGIVADDATTLFNSTKFTPYDISQEPIFPPELMLSNYYDQQSIVFTGNSVTWYRPTTLTELLSIKSNNPDAKIIVGNTEVGVELKFKHCHYPVLVLADKIPELLAVTVMDDGVMFGASVTIMEMDETLQTLINTLPDHETRLFQAIVQMLQYFGGKQIRNVASVGGNIMTCSPISDLIPIFAASEIEMEVSSLDRGYRKLKMNDKFFVGYRKNIIDSNEILISIKIPKTTSNQHFLAFKQSKRRDDDIAIVNMAVNVTFKANCDIIENIKIAYGGMADKVVLATKVCSKIIGKTWNNELVEIMNRELINELPLEADAIGGMILYRKSMTLSLFFKAFLSISQVLNDTIQGRSEMAANEKSGSNMFKSLPAKSAQFFQKSSDNQINNSIGRPQVHMSAFKHATGEAIFCDDIPKIDGELYLALVTSTKAHAKLLNVDASKALQQPGVCAFFSAKDLTTEQNTFGPVCRDEEVFVSSKVTSHGQVVGAIVAINQTIAQKASRMVEIEYEELFPIIVTIEEAIKHQSFFHDKPKLLLSGNIDKAFSEADVLVEGSIRIGGQEHFYLETQAALAIPKEGDEMEMYSSTQNLTMIQKFVSQVTVLAEANIIAKSKRVGGAFGGKQFRALYVALPCAVAAYRLGKPVRCMLDRDEDMLITGNRHPFYLKYTVSATNDGKLTGCDIEIYCNGGYSMDVSIGVLERAMTHFESVYLIPNVRVQGWACKTNIPSNVAFRGFGAPQGMMAGEHIIRDVARALNKSYVEIAQLNLYKNGDRTHFDQEIEHCHIERCLLDCINQSKYYERKFAIDEFNRQNKWRKRGIAIVSTKFGMAYPTKCYNQAGALVQIYTDGSVLLSHGGIEMGQGLHTKMIQIASASLQISVNRIHISETSTDKVPNASVTAASVSSDMNGMAVLKACQELNERLAPYKEQFPNEEWNDWIKKAYIDRVSLSATGFYATPDLGFDKETYKGRIFNYFTMGSAASEVEIDCLTGDHQVIRTDIVMDLGNSINPAIDIGQIEGGFMQGYGLFTLEEMIFASNGDVISRGPGMYKIPGIANIPGEFNVSLLKGSDNPRAIFSSKSVGEPPLFLGASVFFAIKEAIQCYRRENNRIENFQLISPATVSRIRMACHDNLVELVTLKVDSETTPWNVMP